MQPLDNTLCLCMWYILVNQIIFLSITFITMAAYIRLLLVCILIWSDRLLILERHFFTMGVLMRLVTSVLSGGVPYQFLQQNIFYKCCILMASLLYVFSGD